MKKIISLVCVIAMLFAFAVTASAAGSSFDIVQKSLTATEAVYDVTITSDYYVNGIGVYLDLSDAVTKGATVTVAKVDAGAARYVAAQKMVLVTYSPTDGSTYQPGTTTLATITFDMTNVTESFAITKKAESTQTKTIFKHKDMSTFETLDFSSEIAYNYDVTVAPYVAAQPVPVKKAVVPEALTTLVAEDANYTNVAIWKATFSGLQTKGATNIGYDFTKTGSDKNNGKVITTEISGDGDVVFVLALHGVSADEYGKLTFAPYYTVMEVPAN